MTRGTTITAGTLRYRHRRHATGSLGALGAVVDNGTLTLRFQQFHQRRKRHERYTGTLNLTTTGAGRITQGSPISVSTLTATAATGITLTTAGNALSSFHATNSTSGAVSLTNTSTTLTVSGITQSGTAAGSDVTINQTGNLSVTGAISTTAATNGNIGLTTTGGMTFTAGVTAGGSGNVNLIANQTGATAGNFDGIDINGITVQSTTGNVLVQGTGGSGTGSNRGVQTSGAAIIRTTGGDRIRQPINGTGGNASTTTAFRGRPSKLRSRCCVD